MLGILIYFVFIQSTCLKLKLIQSISNNESHNIKIAFTYHTSFQLSGIEHFESIRFSLIGPIYGRNWKMEPTIRALGTG
jgi:hypothetical protein